MPILSFNNPYDVTNNKAVWVIANSLKKIEIL